MRGVPALHHMWELSPDVLTRTPKLHIYSGIQILFSEFLKAAENVKKKKKKFIAPCLIDEVVSLLLIIQTPSGTCLKHSGGLFNRASSSIPYPQVQLWTTVPFSGTAEERAPWRHELHRYSSHTIRRQERPTVGHKYWRYESNVPPVSRPKPLNLYTFCVNFISIIVFCFNESSTLPEGKTPFII